MGSSFSRWLTLPHWPCARGKIRSYCELQIPTCKDMIIDHPFISLLVEAGIVQAIWWPWRSQTLLTHRVFNIQSKPATAVKKGDLVIHIPLIVEKNSNGCIVGQLWLADILAACDQTVLEGTDWTGSKKLELKILQAGVLPGSAHIPTVPGSPLGLRESHFSWECQKSYKSLLQMHSLFLLDDFFPTMLFPLQCFYSWEEKLGSYIGGGWHSEIE